MIGTERVTSICRRERKDCILSYSFTFSVCDYHAEKYGTNVPGQMILVVTCEPRLMAHKK